MDEAKLLGIVLAGAVASLIVFLIMRELMCWYYKINRIVSLLEDIHESLNPAAVQPAGDTGTSTAAPPAGNLVEQVPPPPPPGMPASCAGCGTPVSTGDKFCPKCGTDLG
jgi:hypothetical protein